MFSENWARKKVGFFAKTILAKKKKGRNNTSFEDITNEEIGISPYYYVFKRKMRNYGMEMRQWQDEVSKILSQ